MITEAAKPDLLALLPRLWRQLPARRKRQFALLLGLMLVSALAEVVSLGAILPFLAVIGWFLTAQWRDRLLQNGGGGLQGLEVWIALSLLTLAGIVILLTRLRKRWLKVAVLLVAGLVVLMLMALSSGGSIGFFNIAVLGLGNEFKIKLFVAASTEISFPSLSSMPMTQSNLSSLLTAL